MSTAVRTVVNLRREVNHVLCFRERPSTGVRGKKNKIAMKVFFLSFSVARTAKLISEHLYNQNFAPAQTELVSHFHSLDVRFYVWSSSVKKENSNKTKRVMGGEQKQPSFLSRNRSPCLPGLFLSSSDSSFPLLFHSIQASYTFLPPLRGSPSKHHPLPKQFSARSKHRKPFVAPKWGN